MREDFWVVKIQDKTGLFALSHICQFTCLSKLHKSGKFPILSSRPFQWGRMESGVIYCALQLSGGSWPTPETCSSWPLRSLWFYASVGILFMSLQRPAEFSGIWSRHSLADVHETITSYCWWIWFLPGFLRLLARPYLVVSNSKTADKELLLRGLRLAQMLPVPTVQRDFPFSCKNLTQVITFSCAFIFFCVDFSNCTYRWKDRRSLSCLHPQLAHYLSAHAPIVSPEMQASRVILLIVALIEVAFSSAQHGTIPFTL